MKIYKTGERCPCCGEPIKLTDPETLRLFSMVVDMLGLQLIPTAEKTERDEKGDR